jgi:hypothetical protein
VEEIGDELTALKATLRPLIANMLAVKVPARLLAPPARACLLVLLFAAHGHAWSKIVCSLSCLSLPARLPALPCSWMRRQGWLRRCRGTSPAWMST